MTAPPSDGPPDAVLELLQRVSQMGDEGAKLAGALFEHLKARQSIKSDAKQRRNAALLRLAAHFNPEISRAGAAKDVDQLVRRYGASSWKFDSKLKAMPFDYEGTQKALLFESFTAWPIMPSRRTLIRIISLRWPKRRPRFGTRSAQRWVAKQKERA